MTVEKKRFEEWSKKSEKEKFAGFEERAETRGKIAAVTKANRELDRLEKGRPRGDIRPGWGGDEDLKKIYITALTYGDFALKRRVENVRRKLHPV